jgi:hypothetical protein
MSAPTHDDATILLQVAQLMNSSGLNDQLAALWTDDFDPETADANTEVVRQALGTFELVGTLVKHNLLSAELVRDWIWVEGLWGRVGPAALRMRADVGVPQLYENFEALATGA